MCLLREAHGSEKAWSCWSQGCRVAECRSVRRLAQVYVVAVVRRLGSLFLRQGSGRRRTAAEGVIQRTAVFFGGPPSHTSGIKPFGSGAGRSAMCSERTSLTQLPAGRCQDQLHRLGQEYDFLRRPAIRPLDRSLRRTEATHRIRPVAAVQPAATVHGTGASSGSGRGTSRTGQVTSAWHRRQRRSHRLPPAVSGNRPRVQLLQKYASCAEDHESGAGRVCSAMRLRDTAPADATVPWSRARCRGTGPPWPRQ